MSAKAKGRPAVSNPNRAGANVHLRVIPARAAKWQTAARTWALEVGLNPDRSLTQWITVQCDRAAEAVKSASNAPADSVTKSVTAPAKFHK